MPLPFTQADIDHTKALAHKLATEVLTQAGDGPWASLLALAALTTAACEVAVITDTSFVQLMELVQLHYQAAAVGIAIQELESETGKKFSAKIVTDEGKS